MNEQTYFKEPTKPQMFGTVIILLIACLLGGASDWFDSLNLPSLTIGAIAIDGICMFLGGLLIGVPIAMLVWNKLVAPIFEVRKIRYVHALVLVTVIYWI